MVVKLLKENHQVIVWNRTKNKVTSLQSQISGFEFKDNLEVADTIEELSKRLKPPRVIWSMLPAGEPTEEILKEIGRYVKKNDIVIDGGNSNFKDTQRRYENFKKKGIHFLGIGVSGGLVAFENGYPMMAGGSKEGYEKIIPILDSLAHPNGGHEYFGEGGAGHFVKMVHNGIEYGIMQSIGEGFGVLEKSPYKLDLLKVAKLWQKGTIVSGFLMERTIDSLEKDPTLSQIEGYIEDSGEGRWTVETAKEEKVPIEIIEKSLDFRVKSRKEKKISNSFAARMVAALRHAFGGHEVKRKS